MKVVVTHLQKFDFCFFPLFFALTFFSSFAMSYSNNSFEKLSHGKNVTEESIDLIRILFLKTGLKDISLFLTRIAKVESHFGDHPATYRTQYYGGIWQIDRIAYEETKNVTSHPSLVRLHRIMKEAAISLGLRTFDWPLTTWQDLTMPAFSCVAARLYLALIPQAVPDSLEEQANYWKKYYNTIAGNGTREQFMSENMTP